MAGSTLFCVLLRIIETFYFVSWMETRWNRCLMLSSSSDPLDLARAFASLVSWLMVVGWRPPSVSNGRGQKERPSCSHRSPYSLHLWLYAVFRAWPGSDAARPTKSVRSALMTVMSKQVSLPDVQLRRYRSAGLASDPGRRVQVLLSGDKLAEAAVW